MVDADRQNRRAWVKDALESAASSPGRIRTSNARLQRPACCRLHHRGSASDRVLLGRQKVGRSYEWGRSGSNRRPSAYRLPPHSARPTQDDPDVGCRRCMTGGAKRARMWRARLRKAAALPAELRPRMLLVVPRRTGCRVLQPARRGIDDAVQFSKSLEEVSLKEVGVRPDNRRGGRQVGGLLGRSVSVGFTSHDVSTDGRVEVVLVLPGVGLHVSTLRRCGAE